MLPEYEKITYRKNDNGTICVTGGTLYEMGFGMGEDITIPSEIDGVPVESLDAAYGVIDALEVPSIKYIKLNIMASPPLKKEDNPTIDLINILIKKAQDRETPYCDIPDLIFADNLENFEITFSGERMYFSSCDSEVHKKTISRIKYDTKLLPIYDNYEDWSYFDGGFKDYEKLTECIGNFKADRISDCFFKNCKSLIIPPRINCMEVGNEIFYNCESLKKVDFGDDVKRIGSSAFENCRSLTDIFIPDFVEIMGERIFKNCTSLKTVHLPNKITDIPKEAFYGCALIEKVFLNDDIEEFGEGAFEGCERLKNPWMPMSLKKIGAKAFKGCKNIDFIFLSADVNEIGEDAFADCPNLVIKCCENSAAHEYAKNNNIRFKLV